MHTRTVTAGELAERLGGELRDCPADRVIEAVRPLDEAEGAHVSFLANAKYHEKAQHSRAGLILVDPKTERPGLPLLRMPNPYWGFAQAVGLLAAGPWPMMGRDAAHTGFYPGTLNGQALSLAWSLQVSPQPLNF